MASGDYRVADISLADFGRREIEIAEHEVSDIVYLSVLDICSNYLCLLRYRCLVLWPAERSTVQTSSVVPEFLVPFT